MKESHSAELDPMAHILPEYLIYDLIHLIEIDITRKGGKHILKERSFGYYGIHIVESYFCLKNAITFLPQDRLKMLSCHCIGLAKGSPLGVTTWTLEPIYQNLH